MKTYARLLPLFMAVGLTAHAAQFQQLEGHVPPAVDRLRLQPVGSLPESQRLNLAIGLPLRNREALTNLLRDIYDPASPRFHHYLTPEEFTRQFGPSQEDYEAVVAFATTHHLSYTRHPNRLLLDVSGAPSAIGEALHVNLRLYPHPSEQRQFYAPDREPSLDLAVPVLHISGLDNYSLPKPHMVMRALAARNASPQAGSGPGGAYMGPDFRAAYAPGVTLNGTGQTVGLLQFDGYTASDIAYYESKAGLPSVTLSNVLLDGFTGAPTGSGGEVEVSLDIEMSVSMAPGLAEVILYEAGPYGNWHDILNRMATDNLARQLSCSWYIPGGGPDPVADGIFQQMAAQGQSFFNASGDDDAYTGLISFPGDTPYITQVGGTTLTTTGPAGAYISETVWNWGGGIGSGGGSSLSYAIPGWQTNVSMTANLGSTTKRNTPDVAMTADNVYVRADGRDLDVGGTSCAAPLWAGFCSLVNQQAAFYGKPLVGFVNPAVYALGLSGGYAQAFHDTTMGNNYSPSSPTRFPAVAGYDLCTGWGTPTGQKLIDAFVPPDTLIINPTMGFSGSGAVGGPFTITTENFALTNLSASPLNWSSSNNATWLAVSPGSGTLPAGASSSLTVGLNTVASNLPPGVYSADMLVTNQSTGFVHDLPFALQVHDPLAVSPVTGFVAAGAVGGPFNITSEMLALTNSGTTPVDWSLTNGSTWLSASPSSGTLAGLSTVSVTASLTSVASNLMAGIYHDGVVLSNLDSGAVLSVPFTLETGQLPVQNGGFETGDFSGWTQSGNTGNTLVTSNAAYVHSGVYGAELGPRGTLGYLSQSVPTVPREGYLISFWLENPYGGSPNEFQVLWNGAVVYDQVNLGTFGWTNIQFLVGSAVPNSVLGFGFRNDIAAFGLDDVAVFADAAATNPPTITLQPTNETVTAGWTASFGVDATGIQPITYQWELNGTNVPNATNATLVLSPVNTTEAGAYTAVASNVFGGTASSNAVLTVNPAICSAPPSGLVSWWRAEGDATDSTGTNDGTLSGNVTYAPEEVGRGFVFDGRGAYVGLGNPASLQLQDFTIETWLARRSTSVTSFDGNGLGFIIAYGNSGYGLFLDANGTPGLTKVGISSVQPTVAITDTNLHHVAVTKSGTNVMFYMDGVGYPAPAFDPGFVFNSSATIGGIGNNYSFAGLVDELSVYNRGLSAAEVQSIYEDGSAGKCFTPLSPTITQQPRNQTVTAGNSAGFSVAATGTRPLSYQWQFNNTNLSGATNSLFTLSPVNASEAGAYSVVVSNAVGFAVSSNAVLTVNVPVCDAPPSGLVSWWRAEGNAFDSTGTNNGTLNGDVTYAPEEVGQSFVFDGNGSYVQLGNPASLQLQDFTIETWLARSSPTVTSFDGNGLGLIFTYGNSGYGFFLDANGTPGLTKVGISNVKPTVAITDTNLHHVAVIKSGTNVMFYVDGVGYSAPAFNPGFVFNSSATIGGIGNNYSFAGLVDELSVYNRGLSAAEVQTIYNAGSAGKCFTPVPPAITQQPTNQSVVAGTTVALSVTATGTQLLSYQWQFNNTNLNGATNPLFTLSPVNASEAGAYRVVVSNAFGFAVSSNAVLTVNPAICTAPPAGLVSWWRAEGDATDSGGTNDGTLSGSVTYAPEEVGQGFVFDGNGSYIQLGNPASLQLQDFTIETWLARRSTSVTSLDGNGLGFILAYGNSGYGLFLDAGGVPGLTKLGISSVQPTMAITDTNLHHVAVTKSGSNVVFYVDGAGYPAPAFNPGFVFDSSATIGGISNSYSFYGLVDELSVYNRGLSATEISSIYDAGSAGKCFTPIQPAITQQPTNQTVTAGITAIMNVTAAGTRPLTYQWSFGTNSMPGATNGSLVLPKVQATNAGIYSVVVSNPYGSATSSNAVLTVNNAPVCDPPPSGLVSWWRAEGNAVDAIGTNDGALSGNVAYAPGEVGQGFLFDGAGSYVQLGNPAGLQLQNFTIETWVARSSVSAATGDGNGHAFFMSYGNSGYGFYMLNDGSLGLTKVGISEVQPTVTITDTNLHHVAVTKSGTSVVFYVDGVGYPAPAYDPGFVFDSSATIGGIGNNYSFYGLVDELSVYNRGLSAAEVQSIYNASSAGKCFLPLPPTITQQPTNQTVAVGTTATLGVTVTGTRPLSYQWTLGGLTLPGATNASLILSNVQTTNAGTYAVIVTNIAASVTSSNAVLTVNVPVCDTPPSGLVSWWRAEGNAFDSAGTNNGTVNGNVTYAPEEVGQGFVFDGSGSYVQLGNPASLQLQDFTIETWLARRSSTVTSLDGNGLGLILTYDSNGGYGLFMDASGRPGLTEVGISSVQPTVAITDTNLHHVAVTKSGASVVFYVDGAAYPAPAFNPGFVFNSSATIGGIGNNYSFYGLVDELSVYNRGLSAAEVAAIYNAGSAGKCTPPVAPSITQQPTNQTVVAGTVATLSVTATGTQPLSYQWFFGTNGLAGATNGSLVLTNVQAANAGTYAVTITNIAGGVTSSNAVITVVFVPSIKRQPAPLQLMILGCTATFSATVSGTPPLIYQWLKNGSALNNQTNLSFVLSNVQSSDFATYNLAVTNGYGFAVSSNAVLAPDHLPVANPVTVQRFPGGGLRVDTATVTGADTDADGDELSIIGVSSSSAAGGAVNWTGSSIYYTPPAGYTNADTFGYVVSDGHCGGTAAGFVTVQIKTDTTPYASVTIRQSADGSIQVTFDGEPGYRYRVQKTDGLINPVWQDVTSLTADEFGTFQYVDTPPTNAPTRYYRCVWP